MARLLSGGGKKLAHQVEKLARLSLVVTFIGMLARKKRSWHAFGTLARGHGDHAGTHGTRGTQTALIYETYLINIGPI